MSEQSWQVVGGTTGNTLTLGTLTSGATNNSALNINVSGTSPNVTTTSLATGLTNGLLGARGAILFTAAEAGIPIIHYSARQIKKLLTGSGAASKEQVQLAVQRELRLKLLLEPNDVADATGVALCHYYSLPAITGMTA